MGLLSTNWGHALSSEEPIIRHPILHLQRHLGRNQQNATIYKCKHTEIKTTILKSCFGLSHGHGLILDIGHHSHGHSLGLNLGDGHGLDLPRR